MQLEAYRIQTEPYYLPVGVEVRLFEAAYASRLPVMLKGPTGCGKTRFLNTWLGDSSGRSLPLPPTRT